MDPQQERALDALIATVEQEGEAEAASPAEPEGETREIAEPEGPSQDAAGEVNEGEPEGEDGDEPEDAEPYEVNVADLTPIAQQAQPEDAGTLTELAQLRQEVNDLRGFQTQAQQVAEQAEFRQFLESLKGMDPDEQKDAVAVRIANSYVALQKQVADRNAQDARVAQDRFEAEQRDKAVRFLAQGGRRVQTPQGVKYIADPKLALNEEEAAQVQFSAENGMHPLALEQLATALVQSRGRLQGSKRSLKQQQDSQSGASRTLAGAGAAKPPAKEYQVGELNKLLDDLLDE
jgi:hypothetical protein